MFRFQEFIISNLPDIIQNMLHILDLLVKNYDKQVSIQFFQTRFNAPEDL